MSMVINQENLTVVILAGGRSQRMSGKDKGLLNIDNNYIIKFLYKIALKYTNNIFINANRNMDIYSDMGLTVWKDCLDDFQGPLAGIYTSLLNMKTDYLLTLPCDGPFINEEYFKRMINFKNQFDIRSAHDGFRIQPVHALIKKNMLNSLKNYLDQGNRKIDKWYNECELDEVCFADIKDIFININNPEELLKYKKRIKELINNE